MKSIAHTYAIQALNSIQSVQDKEDENYSKDYGRLCLVFPSMVQVNGLKLTFAFLESKAAQDKHTGSRGTSCYKRFIEDLCRTIEFPYQTIKDFPSEISQCMDLTRKAISASVWFKRYAEAILKVEAINE